MSDTIDRRVVEMRFDNKDFETNVQSTMTVLEKLKDKLNFKGVEREMGSSGISSAIDGVRDRFSALEIVGTTALVNLTNSAVNFAKHMAKTLTIDQIKGGFSEYELKMGSIQTIMASTGETLDVVNQKLNELNEYSDRTIYSFSDMTSNIGKFTNAGVKLDDAVLAIKGISNVAALAGANTNEASRAMYNFSQALSSGSVKLIDWKSIENANMATKGFKEQLIETAVVMGTLKKTEDGYVSTTTDAQGKTSAAFNATKNFNDSLSHQWMTTEVLTQTLANYSVDLEKMTDKQRENWREEMKRKGYTKEQIANIEKLNAAAYAAAQDIKTFSQLVDTIKESIGSGWAQTFELIFGNLEEAKRLWTSVGRVIDVFVSRIANARNEALKMWAANINGRSAMLEGFKNLYHAVIGIAKPIKDAFVNVFPPNAVNNLIAFSTKFRLLTKSMIISEDTADKLRNVFTMFFKALKVGLTVLSSAFKILFSFTKIIPPVIKGVLSLLNSIAELMGFGHAIDPKKGITGWLDSLADVSGKASEKIGQLTGGALGKLGALLGKVGAAAGKLFSLIGKGLSHLDLGKLAALLAGGGILAAGLKISKFLGTISEKIEDLFGKDGEGGGGIFDGIKETLGSLSSAINSFQTSLKVGQLVVIAASIGILAAACSTLADIPVKKLAASVSAIGGLAGELALASRFMTGGKAGGIVAMAFAIDILAQAVTLLSEIPNIKQGIAGVSVLLGELTAFCLIFDRLKIKPKALRKTATGLILMAVAINLLAKPVEELGSMDTGQLVQGLEALGAMLAGFAATAFIFSKINTRGMLKSGLALVVMAAAIRILAKPIKDLGNMDFKSMANGLKGMGIALAELAGFTAIMGKISSASGSIMKSSAALVLMAVGVKIMASAINSMGANENAGQGLSVMFGALVILGGAMALMQKALPGAAAMIVVAGALTIMAPAIALLSSLDMKGVIVGLVALGGTLIIFGGLSVTLAPMILAMIGVAAAIALLGVGVLSLGAGLTMLVTAFSLASGAITEGAKSIANSLPIIAEGLGAGLVTLIDTVGDMADSLKIAFLKLLDALIEVILKSGPKFIEAGIFLLIRLLEGINNNIERITIIALEIITNFINGISQGLPDLVDAGYNLIISFLNSMADAISANGEQLCNALANVLLAAVEVAVGFIPGFGKAAQKAIREYRSGLQTGGKDVSSDAKGIGKVAEKGLQVKDQTSNGENAVKGISKGLENMKERLRTKANEIANIVDNAVRKKNEIQSPSRRLARTGAYMMQGLINGVDSLTDQYKRKADNIATVMIASANRSVDTVSDIMSRGFSDGFDLNSSVNKAMEVSVSMDQFRSNNAELTHMLSKLTRSLDDVTDTMNSRQMVNNIQIDGSADPEMFADALTRRMKLNARTI